MEPGAAANAPHSDVFVVPTNAKRPREGFGAVADATDAQAAKQADDVRWP